MENRIFRGKLKADNANYKKGDWVYGDLVWLEDGNRKIPCIYGKGEVFSSTIGQESGLNDLGGTKIFDGDILEWIDDDGNKHTDIVSFKNGCYVIKADSDVMETLYESLELGMRVIGTIHDEK